MVEFDGEIGPLLFACFVFPLFEVPLEVLLDDDAVTFCEFAELPLLLYAEWELLPFLEPNERLKPLLA